MDLDGADSFSVQYQNANNSVRVTDEFMQAVLDDSDWGLLTRSDGSEVRGSKPATSSVRLPTPPGSVPTPESIRHHDQPLAHSPERGRINGSNPCSEYMHLDNSACNLASINLMKFLNDDDSFDVEGFRAAVEVVFSAQEILVGNVGLPGREKIAENSSPFSW